MDPPCGDEASGWVNVLKRARAAGLRTNLEMVSGPPGETRRLVMPCLPYLDTLIINDDEAGVLTGIDVVSGSVTSAGAARRGAAVTLLVSGPLELVVIHFPGGCVAATRDGDVLARASLEVPADAIRGSNGAGDASLRRRLALYAIHEGWPVSEGLSLGLCAAASALLGVHYGFRRRHFRMQKAGRTVGLALADLDVTYLHAQPEAACFLDPG